MADQHDKDNRLQAYLALTQGATVGRYRVISLLGSGGMGDVYLAEDTELGRRVALKFLALALGSDPTSKARFMREARMVAKLNHPNIVTVYEVGEFKGQPFIAMEYIEGHSLRDYIAEGNIPLDRAIEIAAQIGSGLQEAHAIGIIHRDIKPANVLLDKKGRAKLLDFGLAVMEGAESLTRTGSTLGTVSYMSPEQVLGKEVNERSDIFSLGVVFYEMLTGCLPFRGEREAIIMYSIANEEPEPLNIHKGDLDRNMQALIDELLCKNPQGRIQSAAELLEGLGRLKDRSDSAGLQVEAKKSIAVLYFQDFTRSDEIGWLSKGIPHMLITSLEQSTYIDVVSYQKLFDILNQLGKADLEVISMAVATQVAKRARASMMVTGAVFKYGNSIRIDYQINEVATGRLAKAGKVIGGEPFALADELGTQIRQELEVEDARGKIADVTTHSLEAYRYYLEGMEHFSRGHDKQAAKCFEKAVVCDSAFAMAYFWAAWMMYLYQGSPGNYLGKALKYSKKLSPKERQYIKSLESFFDSDFYKGTERLNSSGADFPIEREAHVIQWFVFPNLEGFRQTIKCVRNLITLDPLLPQPYHHLSYIYLYRGKIERALEMANKYMSLFPKEANPYDMIGEIHAYAGDCLKSIEALKKANQLNNNDHRYITHLGAIYQCTDDYRKAEEYYLKLYSFDDNKLRLMGAFYIGQLACYRGKFEEAIELYNKALAANSSDGANSSWLSRMHLATSHIYFEKGQIADALKEYGQAWKILEANSNRPNANISIGWYDVQLLALQSAFDEAEKKANEIKIDIEGLIPHWIPLYYFMKAIITFEKGDFQGAREYLSQIDISYLNPNRMQIDSVIAKLLLHSGDTEGAVRLLEQLQSNCHFNKAYWSIHTAKIPYLLGIAYEKMGQPEKAIWQFQKYLKMREEADPCIPDVEDAKVRLACMKAKL